MSFTSNVFANVKFHSKKDRVIGNTEQIGLDCCDTAPLRCTVNVDAMQSVNGQLFLSLEDEKSTLFLVFEAGEFYDEDFNEMIEECLIEKLALIPNDTKLLFTPEPRTWTGRRLFKNNSPETLHVAYSRSDFEFVVTMLRTLCKRWQTLDLISIIEEVLRTKKWEHGFYAFSMMNNLSSIPRLKNTHR